MSFLSILRKYKDLTIGYREACKVTNTPCHHPRHSQEGMRCRVCGDSIYTPPRRVK